MNPLLTFASDPNPPTRRRCRRIARAGALAVVLALVGSACTKASPAESGAKPKGTNAPTPVVTTGPPPPPEPDKLADPSVGPGECKVVMYTPPSAKEPMPGELCRPKANQRDVAVIVVHGGSGVGGSYQGMRRWANRYLVEGYVTFLAEYHLFNVGGESPVFPRPEQNIKAAVQFLRGTGNALGIRKDRVVVQGQSAGARIGAVAFTTPDDSYFAGPELYPGISDAVNGFIGFYHPYDGTMQFAEQYFGGPETSKNPAVVERYDKGNSLARAQNAVGPALFITGDKDWNIINLQQDAFAAALHQKMLAATTSVVKGGGHGFDEGGQRLSRLGEESATQTLQWLNDVFAQTPARDPQTADADVNNAPIYTGAPPTTYQPRTTWNNGYTPRANTGGGGGGAGGGGGGGGVVTTASSAPTTIAPAPSSSPPPTTLAPPPTTPPPPTTAPPTTAPTTIRPTVPTVPTTPAPPP